MAVSMSDGKIENRRQLAGLGLRRGLMPAFKQLTPTDIDFVEVAPENWIGIGGRYGRLFRDIAERYPVYLHGFGRNCELDHGKKLNMLCVSIDLLITCLLLTCSHNRYE